tara:strand:- start:577 stop:759 length:183 start_codon:yes stop_codon:yes gene_type:complete
MKEQILKILEEHSEQQANLTSEICREKIVDDIFDTLKTIAYDTPNNFSLGEKIRRFVYDE